MKDPADIPQLQPVIDVAREAGRAQVDVPTTHTIDGVPCQVWRTGSITPLMLPEALLSAPRKKRAKVELYDAASFIAYVARHKREKATVIFGRATETAAVFVAVLDYHGDGDGAPAFGLHTVKLSLETTPEWGRWMAKHARFMPQGEFAEHIEDNLNDIISPEPAALLEVAQGLQGMRNVSFKSGRNLQDGAIKLEYVETIEVQGVANRRDSAFKVPAGFRLQIVPFVGSAGVEVDARLRFRIDGSGALTFAYILARPYKVVQDAFTVTLAEIERETGISVMLGSGVIPTA